VFCRFLSFLFLLLFFFFFCCCCWALGFGLAGRSTTRLDRERLYGVDDFVNGVLLFWVKGEGDLPFFRSPAPFLFLYILLLRRGPRRVVVTRDTAARLRMSTFANTGTAYTPRERYMGSEKMSFFSS
jgi:hypothetical protein